MPGEDQRALRRVDERECFAMIAIAWQRVVASLAEARLSGFPIKLAASLLSAFRDVDKHRPGSTRFGNRERLADRGCDVSRAGHQIVVFRDWQRDSCDVRLLKGIRADQFAADLASDADNR